MNTCLHLPLRLSLQKTVQIVCKLLVTIVNTLLLSVWQSLPGQLNAHVCSVCAVSACSLHGTFFSCSRLDFPQRRPSSLGTSSGLLQLRPDWSSVLGFERNAFINDWFSNLDATESEMNVTISGVDIRIKIQNFRFIDL